MAWEDFLQDAGKTIIDKWSSKEYTQDYEIERLRLQALGQYGGLYTEGQAGVRTAGTIGGISTGTLLIGGALLLVVVLMAGRR